MISKEFAKKVVANHANGLKTITRSGSVYYAELLDLGDWATINGQPCAVVVRRMDKADPEYAPIVAMYCFGSGWHICG